MGDVILTMHTSADGFIAQTDKGLWPGFGWPDAVQARLNEVYRRASSVVYGRGVYEAVVPFWSAVHRGEDASPSEIGTEGHAFAHLLASLPKVVASTTHRVNLQDNSVRLTSDPIGEIRRLSTTEQSSVLLLAGPRLVADVLAAGLVDEIILIVGSVILGSGLKLVDMTSDPIYLSLVETFQHPPTTTWLRYQVNHVG